MSERPTVSVFCLAYNHAKYIRHTLEGFVRQRTDFPFRVYVHDDASPDGTADIIREYEERYPDIIRGIYQTENQYRKDRNMIAHFIAPHMDGEYVAVCEGDDYWCDEGKLQRQVDALRAHPECALCLHITRGIAENGADNGLRYPEFAFSEGTVSGEFIVDHVLDFHTSSHLYRGDVWRQYMHHLPEFARNCIVGDFPARLYFAQCADVYLIPEEMSCYRRGAPTSWSMQNVGNVQQHLRDSRNFFETFQAFDAYTKRRFHAICAKYAALYDLQYLTLRGETRKLLTRENRDLLRALPRSRRAFVCLAAVAPRAMRSWYLRRLEDIARRESGARQIIFSAGTDSVGPRPADR